MQISGGQAPNRRKHEDLLGDFSEQVHAMKFCGIRYFAARSKRSRFITLVQAATKSLTNLSPASAQA